MCSLKKRRGPEKKVEFGRKSYTEEKGEKRCEKRCSGGGKKKKKPGSRKARPTSLGAPSKRGGLLGKKGA